MTLLPFEAQASLQPRISVDRLVEGSLANAARHARCRDCRVALSDAQEFAETVSDAGPGFDVEDVWAGAGGLRVMRRRVRYLVTGLRSAAGATDRGERGDLLHGLPPPIGGSDAAARSRLMRQAPDLCHVVIFFVRFNTN